MKAYKLGITDDIALDGILIDFCLNDLSGGHKYYFVNYDGNVNVKKINSIDSVIDYLDRNSLDTKELSKQSLSVLVSSIDYFLKVNDLKNNSSVKLPGTAPLSDFDKKFLKDFKNKSNKNINNSDVNIPNKVSYTGGDYHGKK